MKDNVYSLSSENQLRTCHPDLQKVFRAVLKLMDHKIIEGKRGEEAQERAVLDGKSKVHWPDGEHNSDPSNAVDAMPVPIDWKDAEKLHYFAGLVVGTAAAMGIKIRWGGDFNMDTDFKNDAFVDGDHFERIA